MATTNLLKRFAGCFLALCMALNVCLILVFIRMAHETSASVFLLSRGFTQLAGCIAFACLGANTQEEVGKIKTNWKWILVRFLCALVMIPTTFYSAKLLPVAQLSVLGQLRPIVTVLLARLFLKEKLTWLHITACILVMSGAVLVIQPAILFHHFSTLDQPTSEDATLGFILVGISTLLISTDVILTRKLNQLNIHWTTNNIMIALSCLIGGGAAYIVLLHVDTFPEIPFTWQGLCQDRWPVLGVCLLGFLKHFCLYKALQYEKVSVVTVLLTTEVLFGFLLGLLIFPEDEYNVIHFGGALLIVIGVLMVGLYKVWKEVKNTPA